jgi:hypothetical protein
MAYDIGWVFLEVLDYLPSGEEDGIDDIFHLRIPHRRRC